MPGNGAARTPSGNTLDVLENKTYQNERQISDLADAMRAGFAEMRRETSASIDKLALSIGGIQKEVADRNKTPWQALSVLMGALVIFGGMAYWPVRENQADTKEQLMSIRSVIAGFTANYVSRNENDRLRTEDKDRAAIVRNQLNDDIKQLTEAVNTISRTFVPRVEAEAIARLQEKLADERAKNTELRLNRHSTAIDRLTAR